MFMSLLVYELFSLCEHIIPKLRCKGNKKNAHTQARARKNVEIAQNSPPHERWRGLLQMHDTYHSSLPIALYHWPSRWIISWPLIKYF